MKTCLWLGLVEIWILTEDFGGGIKTCGHVPQILTLVPFIPKELVQMLWFPSKYSFQ